MNINDRVVVRLTPYGEELWAKVWNDITHGAGVPKPVRVNNTDADGRVHFHLWDLMKTFGPYLYHGSGHQMFVGNVVDLEEPHGR